MNNEKEILLEIIEKILDEGKNHSLNIDYNLLICYKHIVKLSDTKIVIQKGKLYCAFEDDEKELKVYQIDNYIEKLYFNKIRDLKLKQLGI